MAKNGKNITSCHLLPFLICVCQRVYLRVSLSSCCGVRCVWNMNVFIEMAMVYATRAKSILQYVILHFIFSTFNHFHTTLTTTIATTTMTTIPTTTVRMRRWRAHETSCAHSAYKNHFNNSWIYEYFHFIFCMMIFSLFYFLLLLLLLLPLFLYLLLTANFCIHPLCMEVSNK